MSEAVESEWIGVMNVCTSYSIGDLGGGHPMN